MLVIDVQRDTAAADVAFARDWNRWFVEHPALEVPPALVVLTGLEHPDLGGIWSPPYDWEKGLGLREVAARTRINALRSELPPCFTQIVAVGLPESAPYGVVEHVLPALASLTHRAERAALIRHLHRLSTRSRARRLVSQVGEQAHWLWDSLRARKKPPNGT